MELKTKYKKEILPNLKQKFEIKNDLEVPRMEKVVLNVGFGRHSKEKAYIQNVLNTLSRITGQKAVPTLAKKSIASFKVRQGMTIGAMVTLRGDRMYDFVTKLVSITFPNIRDFRGITDKKVDKNGNFNIGFKEHVAFGEIRNDEVDSVHGLSISIHTNAKTREQGLELFKLLGFPFKKEEK